MARMVSEAAQDLFADLLAWELFDVPQVDPRLLLRQASLDDLSIVTANVGAFSAEVPESCVLEMLGLELHYRQGLIEEWGISRDGPKVNLLVRLKAACQFISLSFAFSNSEATLQ